MTLLLRRRARTLLRPLIFEWKVKAPRLLSVVLVSRLMEILFTGCVYEFDNSSVACLFEVCRKVLKHPLTFKV